MIYRVRLEGGASSSDQLEREFRALASQVAQVSYLEGVSGREMLAGKTVIESRLHQAAEEVKIGNSRYWFDWEGRHTFELNILEGDFEPLQPHDQPDYEVTWTPTAYEGVLAHHGGQIQAVAAGEPHGPPQKQPFMIVLNRQNGDPGPRSGMAHVGASRLLSDVAGFTGVQRVAVGFEPANREQRMLGDNGTWIVTISFEDGRDTTRFLHADLDEAAGLAYQSLLVDGTSPG